MSNCANDHPSVLDEGAGALGSFIERHELFDKEWELEDADAIREALTIVHGPYAAEEIATYFAAQAAATSMAEDEEEAWRRVTTLEPCSREDLAIWLAYVNEHAGRQDTAVTLAMALAHVGGMLAERLPAYLLKRSHMNFYAAASTSTLKCRSSLASRPARWRRSCATP